MGLRARLLCHFHGRGRLISYELRVEEMVPIIKLNLGGLPDPIHFLHQYQTVTHGLAKIFCWDFVEEILKNYTSLIVTELDRCHLSLDLMRLSLHPAGLVKKKMAYLSQPYLEFHPILSHELK